jgi:hypothetical protein
MEAVQPFQSRPLIMLTGGLRTRAHLDSALSQGHAQLLGIGRMAVVRPDIPTLLATSTDRDPYELFAPEPELEKDANWLVRWISRQLKAVNFVGAGLNVAWYNIRMRELGMNQPINYEGSGFVCVLRMQFWCSNRTYYTLKSLGIATCLIVIGSVVWSMYNLSWRGL